VFTLTKGVDSFTPTLAQAAITGHPYTSMVITIHSHAAGQQTTVITYELTHVGVVDDHQQFERISHDAPLGTVKELITLRYNTIRCKVGTTTTGWDWVTHSKA
jgi:type VI protein secretion system component Hcp